jgi:hypothetical protein
MADGQLKIDSWANKLKEETDRLGLTYIWQSQQARTYE